MTAAIYARKSTEQNGVTDDRKSVTRQVEQAQTEISRQVRSTAFATCSPLPSRPGWDLNNGLIGWMFDASDIHGNRLIVPIRNGAVTHHCLSGRRR